MTASTVIKGRTIINPNVVTNGLVMYLDAGNPRSYSPNVHPYSKDLYSWITSAYQMTLSRDTTISSPIGNSPIKSITTGTSGYWGSNNSSTWNLAPTVIGETWTVSFWVKGSSSTTGNIFIFGANSSGNFIEYGLPAYNITTDWVRVSGSYTMANASTAYVQVRLDCYTNATTFWVDGLQVEKNSTLTTFNPLVNVNGTSILDLSGYGNKGELVSGVIYKSNNGGTLSFDGTTGYTESSSIVLPTNKTIDVWFNRTGAVNYYSPLVEQGVTNPFRLIFQGNIAFGNDGNQDNYYATTPTFSALNTWYNVVAIYNGSYNIYVNGVSQSLLQYVGQYGPWGTDKLHVGYRPYTVNVSAFNGYISNVRIYNRALSQSEITQNYNALKSRYNLA